MYSKEIWALDLDTAARTVWGEARGDSSKQAVAHVIVNRAERGGWWGDTIHEVCRKPYQFSCWNKNDPNRDKMLALEKDDQLYKECLAMVAFVVVSDIDPTDGATHYHTKGIVPPWAVGKKPCLNQGNHLFYNDID
jgi:spore germination cell wall hydrolase CwlJ-like protein